MFWIMFKAMFNDDYGSYTPCPAAPTDAVAGQPRGPPVEVLREPAGLRGRRDLARQEQPKERFRERLRPTLL